jgi:hypothetical protein
MKHVIFNLNLAFWGFTDGNQNKTMLVSIKWGAGKSTSFIQRCSDTIENLCPVFVNIELILECENLIMPIYNLDRFNVLNERKSFRLFISIINFNPINPVCKFINPYCFGLLLWTIAKVKVLYSMLKWTIWWSKWPGCLYITLKVLVSKTWNVLVNVPSSHSLFKITPI